MKIEKLIEIDGLAQNFLKAPRISIIETGLNLTYDFESTTGEYIERNIFFKNAKDYRHIKEKDVITDMIKVYNSIGIVKNSEWLDEELKLQDYKHYIIYFDEYGVYEILAKEFIMPD